MYEINKRKMNRIQDDYHRMLCIIRAISEQFHVSPELLKVSKAKYVDYYNQLENGKIIVRVEETEYLAEYYNILIDGVLIFKKGKGKRKFSAEVNIGFAKLGYSHEF